MFEGLDKIRERPVAFGYYTTDQLWQDEYVSEQMLRYHLEETGALASRDKEFIDRSVGWMMERFGIAGGMRIGDFGCGPGLYAGRLAERGAQVTGIDFSERSIEHAKQAARDKNLEIDYICQDYLSFSTDKKFDLILLIYYDFCVLSPAQRAALLKIFYECLDDQGTVILDVLSTNFFDSAEEQFTFEFSAGDGFWSKEPYYLFSNTLKYEEDKLYLDKHVIYERARVREIYNWLQCYSVESLRDLFAQNGFKIREQYKNLAGEDFNADSTEFAVVAGKKS
ncbi:MAG: class I SAM-dependent methyltransferase [Planctomycetes bacterium]|nr:class I SAM-dependent methyltransferase [Planctomycetota bacterium]